MRLKIGLVLSIIIFLIICFFQLDSLPGEWYGDISIENNYVQSILHGEFPTAFITSNGPVQHYLEAPIIAVIGSNYLGYKIASVIIGLIGLICIILLANELLGVNGAVIVGLLTATSFVYILFSRLGNSPQIVTPILSALTLFGLVRFYKYHQFRDLLVGLIFSGLGLFTYPNTFVLPAIFMIIFAIDLLRTKNYSGKIKSIGVVGLGLLITVFLFWLVARQDVNNFTHGYIGSKLAGQTSISTTISIWGNNILKALGGYIYIADNSFRTNAQRPQLDLISSIFGGLGFFIYLINKQLRSKFHYLIIPFILLILPSTMPGIPTAEIPSNSRTLAALPFVILVVATGLNLFASFFKYRIVRISVVIILITVSAVINLKSYFVSYAYGLPNHNSPYGKIIATYINSFPKTIHVYLTGCCWGDWGQPEPEGIYNQLNSKINRDIIRNVYQPTCAEITQNLPALIILNPKGTDMIHQYQTCFPRAKLFQKNDVWGNVIFESLEI
jgi:hypothetical protein